MNTELECIFCHLPEPDYTPGKDAIEIVCSTCTMRLAGASREQFQEAHRIATEKGFKEKADTLSIFTDELGENNGSQAGKTGASLVRKKLMRMARPSLHQKRKKQAAR